MRNSILHQAKQTVCSTGFSRLDPPKGGTTNITFKLMQSPSKRGIRLLLVLADASGFRLFFVLADASGFRLLLGLADASGFRLFFVLADASGFHC